VFVVSLQEKMISLEAFSGTVFDLRPSLIPSRQPSGVGIVALGRRNLEMGKSDLESLGVGLGHLLSWSVTLETRVEITRGGDNHGLLHLDLH